jgi:hypothetical protein
VRQIENLVFIILIGCLLICALFWRQVSRLQLPKQPPLSPAAQSRETIEKLPSVLSAAQLASVEPPKGRDVFNPPWSDEDKTPPKPPRPEDPIILSTIVWSQTHPPMAVINGEILSVGDTDSKSEFIVEAINRESVQVRRIKNQKTVLLVPSGN